MAGELYAAAGVDYSVLDYAKRRAQAAAQETAGRAALSIVDMEGVEATRGESAFVVWTNHSQRSDRSDYRAQVTEGLGTKALVADGYRDQLGGGPSHYGNIAKDTVATIANNLITVGAMPEVLTAYWAVHDANWFGDRQRTDDLITSWRDACIEAGAIWGGGETTALKDILQPGRIELAGTMTGRVLRGRDLTLQEDVEGDESIILLHGSGIHASGLSLARKIANELPEGYLTPIDDGRTYGEALLTPTPIYVSAVRALLQADIEIRYMTNITGHGFRKLMRPESDFTYRLHSLPLAQPEFAFMQRQLDCTDSEMYGTFNMGAGYAFLVNPGHAADAMDILHANAWPATLAGTVEPGPKQVILEPNGVTFTGDGLNIR